MTIEGANPGVLCGALGAFLLLTLATSTVRADDEVLDRVRSRLEAARERVRATESAPPSPERAELLLSCGDAAGAAAAARACAPGAEDLALTPRLQRIVLRASMRLHDYPNAAPLAARLREPDRIDDPEDRALIYEWAFATGDRASVQDWAGNRIEESTADATDRVAAGTIRLDLHDPDGAETLFRAALEQAGTARQRMEAWIGLAKVAQKRQDWDGSLELLTSAVAEDVLDPGPLLALVETRIRRGETDAATAATELALELDPYSETAHYMLGNGYARKNYTQLYAAYPGQFADGAGRDTLAVADSLFALGRFHEARQTYLALSKAHPAWADVRAHLGSLDFSEARYDSALTMFQSSLRLCPEYGRAHHGIAKSLEKLRVAFDIHTADDQREFAATPFPDVPNIEKFVVNWQSLSPRHQKRVALSIQPWQRFLPVLIAGGHTYYIKPIHELLSETPGQETLRDQRISYDSRLWDDVRGCGGYHTVTGIEDVERTIFHNYDTVLHELTHQVHGVMPPDVAREIEELYRQTKERDAGTGNAFLSRYAGGSVWEYFAEGANALSHPRRDEFDRQEIVQERLLSIDPELARMVERLETEYPLEPCYPITYANRGNDALERGRPDDAVTYYQQALDLEPDEPNALASMVYALEVGDRMNEAAELGAVAPYRHPEDGTLAVRRASTEWHAGAPLADVLARLEAGRPKIREADLPMVDLEIGRLRWVLGDGAGSLDAYRRALAVQSDMPEAIWGAAMAQALAGEWNGAWADYDRAVRSRTGLVELRCDFALDLLRAGEMERAAE
ncbi:MAG: tetratricopeptide repeat protein, partial [Candidatus Eisenbacteria bacterium]|nr:tetratricopeptide repeat protein [Candidatus Eisenbacteria bacterium]